MHVASNNRQKIPRHWYVILTKVRHMESDTVKDFVLCYGRDPKLLATRSTLLSSESVVVTAESDEDEFQAELLRLQPQVLLLCQSLRAGECLSASTYAEANSPHSKLLIMVNMPGKCVPPREHATLHATDGPRALIKIVTELRLASRHSELLQHLA
jgi:hypothetical protein